MFEILQWIFLLGLGGIVGWFWKERSHHSAAPSWMTEIEEGDWVTQADLDQYHLRVVQLSHAQRDLLLRKIEVLENRMKVAPDRIEPIRADSSRDLDTPRVIPPIPVVVATERVSEATPLVTPVHLPPDDESSTDQRTLPMPGSGDFEEWVARAETKSLEDAGKQSTDWGSSDPTAQVLRFWREGKPIDQIARELRMGRQEVQLLIEMSRHIPVAVPRG